MTIQYIMTPGCHCVKTVPCLYEVDLACYWFLRFMACLAITYYKIVIKLLVYFKSTNMSWNAAVMICIPVHDEHWAPVSWYNFSWHFKYSFYEKNQTGHFVDLAEIYKYEDKQNISNDFRSAAFIYMLENIVRFFLGQHHFLAIYSSTYRENVKNSVFFNLLKKV